MAIKSIFFPLQNNILQIVFTIYQIIIVTLEEIAGLFCIKAVWEIEDFEGYG